MVDFLLNRLTLAFPPISNIEGEWLFGETEVREQVSRSKLYAIVQRSALKFENFAWVDGDAPTICFDLACTESELRANCLLPVLPLTGDYTGTVEIDLGDKIIRLWTEGEDRQVLEWFTPDKLLFDRWRGQVEVEGLDGFRAFTDFDLLYVGISKRGDSFSRLYRRAHETRLRILTLQHPKNNTSELTHEVMVLLFDVEANGVIRRSDDAVEGVPVNFEPATLAADAEKALVSLLDPQYNRAKYLNYPKGTDGLHGAGLKAYCYWLSEDLTLRTEAAELVGRSDNRGDLIFVEDGKAFLLGEEALHAVGAFRFLEEE